MVSSSNAKKSGVITALATKLAHSVEVAKRVAKEDPRRVVHGVKVGIAVSLVSLFYYLHPLYGTLGESAMWAVLTVVVVFEFSAGATIGKGVNRIGATCAAGGLAVGVESLARLCGDVGEPILLLVCGFVVAAVLTFMRFIPEIKTRYDYGLMIFILTFSMVTTDYHDGEVIPTVWTRLATIIVGCAIAMGVCVLVCPVWSGQELHNLIASNLDNLASFLEGFGDECCKGPDQSDKSFLVKYKSVLTTKVNEESMANFARWEPRHGQFRFHQHPWNQYLKIGALARQCANKIDALNLYPLSSNKSQANLEQFKKLCMRLSLESGKTLKELSQGMKKIKSLSLAVQNHITECKSTADELKNVLTSKELNSEGLSLIDLLPVITIASMLIEIVMCIEDIAEAVQELVLDMSLVHQEVAVESAVASLEEPNSIIGNTNGDLEVVVVVKNVVEDEPVFCRS